MITCRNHHHALPCLKGRMSKRFLLLGCRSSVHHVLSHVCICETKRVLRCGKIFLLSVFKSGMTICERKIIICWHFDQKLIHHRGSFNKFFPFYKTYLTSCHLRQTDSTPSEEGRLIYSHKVLLYKYRLGWSWVHNARLSKSLKVSHCITQIARDQSFGVAAAITINDCSPMDSHKKFKKEKNMRAVHLVTGTILYGTK